MVVIIKLDSTNKMNFEPFISHCMQLAVGVVPSWEGPGVGLAEGEEEVDCEEVITRGERKQCVINKEN